LTAESKKREALTGQVNNLQQMSMILPLLSSQKTVQAKISESGVDTPENVVVDNGGTLSRMLPMLLFSGMGNTGRDVDHANVLKSGAASDLTLLFAGTKLNSDLPFVDRDLDRTI